MVDSKVRLTRQMITEREISEHKREILDDCLLVTVDAAARVMACSTRTVRRYISDGDLAAYSRNGGAASRGTRILAKELRDFVSSIKVEKFK